MAKQTADITYTESSHNSIKSVYTIFLWHGFFLAITKSMLDLNTIFPALVSQLTHSKIIFGLLYSIMLGVPFIFNIFLGHWLHSVRRKKKFLLLGIYLRSLAFFGMAVFIYLFASKSPVLVIVSLFFWIFLFSFSGGFAGLSYGDIIGKLVPKGNRGKLYATKQFIAGFAGLLGGGLVVKVFSLESLHFPHNYAITLLIGFAGLVIASTAFWFIREPLSNQSQESRDSFRQFLRRVPSIIQKDNSFFWFLIVENMASFSLMMLPFYMVYAKDTFQVGAEYVGKYLLWQIAGTILSNVYWGFISQRKNSDHVVRQCVAIGGLIPILALLLQPLGPDYFGIVFLFIGFVISGRRVGFEPYLLDLAPEDQRTIYLGINGTLNFSVVLLPILGGIFIQFLGYQVTFIMTTVIMLLASFLTRKFKEN